jgi:hypothetical protein
MKILLGVTTVFFACASASAQLAWESREFTWNASYADTRVVAVFKFKNAGTDHVAISSIKSSCDCTTAALVKTDYAPGEAGEIVATFNFGNRSGPQEKTIRVQTGSGEADTHTLTLKVNIPVPVGIAPALLFWKTGEERVQKTITITVPADSPVKVLGVESSIAAVVAELAPSGKPHEFSLKVTPPDDGKPLMATLTLKTESAIPLARPFCAYVVVR